MYRSDDTSVLRIESKDYKPREARELKMGSYTGEKPLLPERLTPLPADHSRVLDAHYAEPAARK